jgi:hypothetical protein
LQDVFKFPGAETVYSGDLKLTKLHDAAVAEGTMGQMLVWLSFLEIFGTAAVVQMLRVHILKKKVSSTMSLCNNNARTQTFEFGNNAQDTAFGATLETLTFECGNNV